MDNLFYRKQRKRNFRTSLKKLLKNKRAMLAFLLGVPLLLVLLFGDRGIVQRMKLTKQKAELEQKIQRAEAEAGRLQTESKALDGDKRAIERVAREKYGMVREGETVYKVAKK